MAFPGHCVAFVMLGEVDLLDCFGFIMLLCGSCMCTCEIFTLCVPIEFPISMIQLSQDGLLYIYIEWSQVIFHQLKKCIYFSEDRFCQSSC